MVIVSGVLECWSDGVMLQGRIFFFYNTPILHFSISPAEPYPIILNLLLLIPLLLFISPKIDDENVAFQTRLLKRS